MKLEKRPLGSTGFNATILGIGDLADRSVPLDRCVMTLHRAMDFGLNLIDTAPGYESGYSEEIVGAALRGRREGMFVVDKIDELDQAVAPQVEASLRRLQMEWVDLFVFHGLSSLKQWTKLTAPGGGMEQLSRTVAAGRARFRGISCHHPEVLQQAITSGLCDVVMFPIGPYCDARYLEVVLPLARQAGVGSICFKTFGAGKLLGDTTGYNRPLEIRPRGKFSSGGRDTDFEPTLPRLGVAECLHYTLTAGPDVALLGLSFPNEQDAVFEALADFQPLTGEAMKETRKRAVRAMEAKGPCWWNPPEPPSDNS
ncbi:MAG: aldo/keto reductase [Verrucomicrobia bacterium]|jgi:aryl-alcohol dehydrogenase-like predicted oxidoreductase|nr:aldo/keto reductase [Verrucomicrobiota bacterium]